MAPAWEAPFSLPPASSREPMAREYVWLKCTESGDRNYRVEKEMRGTDRLEVKKYCPKLRKHTVHKEDRKK